MSKRSSTFSQVVDGSHNPSATSGSSPTRVREKPMICGKLTSFASFNFSDSFICHKIWWGHFKSQHFIWKFLLSSQVWTIRFSLIGRLFNVMTQMLCGSYSSEGSLVNWSCLPNSVTCTWASSQLTSIHGLWHANWVKDIDWKVM